MKLLSKQIKHKFNSFIIGLQILFLLFLVLLPIIWLLSTSLKGTDEMFSANLSFIPKEITFDNYIKIWKVIPYAVYIKNSILIALYTSIVTLFFSTLAAYSFSRFKNRGKKLIMGLMMISQMFPAILLIIPIFIYMNKLGLGGKYTGVVIAYQTFLLPFCTWALTNFFNRIPYELDEAGRIDGCNQIQILVKIILPVSVPGLVSVATYSFLGAWNEFIYTMTLMGKNVSWTVPVGLNALAGQYGIDWGYLTAGGVICLVPAILVMLFLQRFLIEGMLAGSIKG